MYPGEAVDLFLAVTELGGVVEIGWLGEIVGEEEGAEDLFVNLVPDVGLALERGHIGETGAGRDRDRGEGLTGEFIADVFYEEEDEDVILVLGGIHAAAEFVAAGPEGGVEFGFLEGHEESGEFGPKLVEAMNEFRVGEEFELGFRCQGSVTAEQFLHLLEGSSAPLDRSFEKDDTPWAIRLRAIVLNVEDALGRRNEGAFWSHVDHLNDLMSLPESFRETACLPVEIVDFKSTGGVKTAAGYWTAFFLGGGRGFAWYAGFELHDPRGGVRWRSAGRLLLSATTGAEFRCSVDFCHACRIVRGNVLAAQGVDELAGLPHERNVGSVGDGLDERVGGKLRDIG